MVQEAAEVTSIFAAKHNLQGGGRVIPLVGLDHPVALPERIASGIAEFDRAKGAKDQAAEETNPVPEAPGGLDRGRITWVL